jgi:hypothetical protein
MIVCPIAVILGTSFSPWARLPRSFEIGCGVTVRGGDDDDWSQRYKANLEKLASGMGNLRETAEGLNWRICCIGRMYGRRAAAGPVPAWRTGAGSSAGPVRCTRGGALGAGEAGGHCQPQPACERPGRTGGRGCLRVHGCHALALRRPAVTVKLASAHRAAREDAAGRDESQWDRTSQSAFRLSRRM